MSEEGNESASADTGAKRFSDADAEKRAASPETLLNAMVDVVIELDSEGYIVSVNDSCEEMLGYDAETIRDKPVEFLFADETADTTVAISSWTDVLDCVRTEQECPDIETLFETKDGETIPVSLSVAGLRDTDDTITGVVCVGKNIHERKKSRRESEFIHSLLRHDLGNKLEVAHGNLEVAVYEDFHDIDRLLESSLASMKEAIDLIRNVRMVEQLEDDVEPEPTNLATVIDDVTSQYDELAADKEIEMEIEIEQPPEVLAGGLLKELLANLIENALHHSDGSVVCIQTIEHGETVSLVVEDDGRGLPPGRENWILEKGNKGDDSTGSGLGTYLVKRIAEIYDAEVAVDKSPLGGARFEVTLPAV